MTKRHGRGHLKNIFFNKTVGFKLNLLKLYKKYGCKIKKEKGKRKVNNNYMRLDKTRRNSLAKTVSDNGNRDNLVWTGQTKKHIL